MSPNEARNFLDGVLLAVEGYAFKEERAMTKALDRARKAGVTGDRHALKIGIRNMKVLGRVTGVGAIGISWWEASEKGTTGAYSLLL
jgi:hypothetical protein